VLQNAVLIETVTVQC